MSRIPSFCVSANISLLAAPILKEHRSLKQQFSSSNNLKNEHEPLSQLLVKILAKPRIACYVRNLIVDCSLPKRDGLERPQASWFDSASLQLIRTAIGNTCSIRAVKVDAWLQAIQDSTDDQSSLALLLLHLSDLDSLVISLTVDSLQYIWETSRAIQQAPAGTHLLHLKRVSIDYSGIDSERSVATRMFVGEFLVALMALPSLDSFDVKGLDIFDKDWAIYLIKSSQRFNITDLSFFDCTIGAKTLNEMLKKTQKLESFSCVFNGVRLSSQKSGIDWYWLSSGLVCHTKHSLKKLHFQYHGLGFLGAAHNLRELKELREIHIELPVFLDGEDLEGFRAMLPASIQEIHLSASVSPSASNEDASTKLDRTQKVVLSIMKYQNYLLPQLTEVCVSTGDKSRLGVSTSIFADASKACHSRGISFNLD